MSETACHCDAAEVEVCDCVGVDVGRQGQRWADDAVFGFGDQVGFPAETVDLPGAEEESGYGDDGWCWCQQKQK